MMDRIELRLRRVLPWALSLLTLLAAAGLALSSGISAGAAPAETEVNSAAVPIAQPMTWLPSRDDGFARTAGSVEAAIVHDGRLYVGLAAQTDAPMVWAYHPTLGWSACSTIGFGGPGVSVRAMAVYHDLLYAGTQDATGAQVWAFNGSTWTVVAADGIGSPANDAVTALVPFGERLYAGTRNADGAEVWAFDGQQWVRYVSQGLIGADNVAVTALAEHAGQLYAATQNAQGGQVWRSGDGQHWDVVGLGGFGEPENVAVTSLASWRGALYAATQDASGSGGDIWRYDGSTWQAVASDGFASLTTATDRYNAAITALQVHEDELYAGTVNDLYGAQVWHTDGAGWWPSSKTGFGLGRQARAVRTLTTFNGAIWAGVENGPDAAAVFVGQPLLDLQIAGRSADIVAPNSLHYDVSISNTLGITLTGMQAFLTWESSGSCVYDPNDNTHLRWDVGDIGPNGRRGRVFTLFTHSWCETQDVVVTLRLQGENLPPMFAFASTTVMQAPTPTATRTPSATPSQPQTIVLQSGVAGYAHDVDTHLSSAAPARSLCQEARLRVGANREIAGLVQFDLSALPAGARVVSATLSLYSIDWSQGRDITVGVFPISRTVEVCQATWNEARAGNPWTLPGCQSTESDRSPLAVAQFTTQGLRRWNQVDVTGIVSEWMQGAVPNNGLLLLGATEDSEIHAFASANHEIVAERPRLSVAYYPPAPPTATPTSTATATATETMTPVATATATATTTPECPDQYEPNDLLAEATSIGWGGQLQAYLCDATDQDYYYADLGTLPFNGFRVLLRNLPADYSLAVYTVEGQLLAASEEGGVVDETAVVEGGQVYLHVYGVEGTYDPHNPYTLDVIPLIVPTVTATPTSTGTQAPTLTATGVPEHTATHSPTMTNTPGMSATPQATATLSATPSVTPSATATLAPTATLTSWRAYLPLVRTAGR